jgi:hypothetical protein
MSEPKIPLGVLISGICMGAKSEQDGDYTNHRLFIKVGERLNEVGETESIIEAITLFGADVQTRIQQANELKGKHIAVPVIRRPARRDLRSAYMQNIPTRNSHLQLV